MYLEEKFGKMAVEMMNYLIEADFSKEFPGLVDAKAA
jgi:hypothetical protein